MSTSRRSRKAVSGATQPHDLEQALRAAVRAFWRVRSRQAQAQGRAGTGKDRGTRAAVTGGAHLDGFIDLLAHIVESAGIPRTDIHRRRAVELPGFYRAEKKWDLVVVSREVLVAAVEVKAHVGPSFGNNYNNRTEEALGSATDYWAAYREKAFGSSPPPWLGYLMVLEDAPGSTRPVAVAEPHFRAFQQFHGATYARRYELLLERMLGDRLYDAAALLLTPATAASDGEYTEPCQRLAFSRLASSLLARALAHARFVG